MTSFGVLMTVYDRDLPPTSPIVVPAATYALVGVALVCFAATFVIFCLMRAIDSNANSIHINLALVLFIANLVFISAIDRPHPSLACKFAAILMHFFYLCSFSWLFVEALHLYRMITEVRNVNTGPMRFYYVLGYVVPAVIVCLAVGLHTDGYGENGSHCWFEIDVLFMWSFAAPIAVAASLNVVVFVLAMRASCTPDDKHVEPDHSYMRHGLYVLLILLPLLSVTWIFGLLSASEDMVAFHYIFALLTTAQGATLLVGYVICSRQTQFSLKYTLLKMQGKNADDSCLSGAPTRSSTVSRSALAYHAHDSSLDGDRHVAPHGISTTTSSTTSKSGPSFRSPKKTSSPAKAASINSPDGEFLN